MGLLPRRLRTRTYLTNAMADVGPEWAGWCARWRATSTLAPKSVDGVCHSVLRAGRWLACSHPEVHGPDDWTRDIALEYVASVNQAEVGEFATASVRKKGGTPLSPRSKDRYLTTLRIFSRDWQEWGWCARHFDPGRALATPKAIRHSLGRTHASSPTSDGRSYSGQVCICGRLTCSGRGATQKSLIAGTPHIHLR
jgi:hypothetical protein